MEVLSIGILAHNEAATIDATIRSLARQTVFDADRAAALGIGAVEVVVVPNGCSDNTGEVAKTALDRFPEHVGKAVRDLPEAGKSNAWNHFVHRLSRADATRLVLMDADIDFGSVDVIEQLLQRLSEDPLADVTTDRPVKDYRHRAALTLFDRVSRRVSQQVGPAGLCGQLYCGRSNVLRRIWLPIGLPVEDGFLAAMLATAGFTRPPDERSIALVAAARHFYEPLSGMSAFVRHEARIIVGSVINSWLFALLWEAGKEGHVGELIRDRNIQEPRWVEAVCEGARASRGRWLVPESFVLWRFSSLRNQPFLRKANRTPIAVAATLAGLPAVVRANAILRRPAARLHW